MVSKSFARALCLIGLLAPAASDHAFAADANGTYKMVQGITCKDFNGRYAAEAEAAKGRDPNNIYSDDYIAAFFYIAGWLSKYNLATPDTYDIEPDGLRPVTAWIDGYCNGHPDDQLEKALIQFTDAAAPKRARMAP
jgi:hypothetical protein